jgi:PST family polysaccharide transporter
MIHKALSIVIIILLVKEEGDYMLVPLIDGLGSILAGIMALVYIRTEFKIGFLFPSLMQVVFQFKNSWHVFLSQIAVHFYTTINIFVLGLLTDNTTVGYYSLAYKVYGAIKGLLAPVNKAIFPFLSKKYVKSREAYYKLIKKVSIIYMMVLSILALLTHLFSSEIIALISGKDLPPAVELLEIFSFSMFFAIGAFFSLLLVIKSENKILSKITFWSMIVNLVLLYPSISLFGIYGLAYHFLIVQMFHAYMQIKYNIEIWKLK